MNLEDPLEDELLSIKPRDYKCPCGKTYLSYAALFTHIKQKHDGVVSLSLYSLLVKSPNLLPSTKKEEDLQLSKNNNGNNQTKWQIQIILQTATSHYFLHKTKNKKLFVSTKPNKQSNNWLYSFQKCLKKN